MTGMMTLGGFAAVGGGAALGAWARWGLGVALNPLFPTVPLGTLAANLIGGYLVGFAVALFHHHAGLSPELKLFLITGFLGGRGEIAEAIQKNQVVIVCGETGSGKTTQLPKICLELGRGAHGLIGHTQPRRIAARAVATRIAQELRSELGRAVGYKVRFTDRVSPATATSS
jgi:hypothetical protein